MTQLTVLSYGAAAGALTDTNQDTFELKPYMFRGNVKPTITAVGLGDAETVNFWVPKSATAWRKAYTDHVTPAEIIIDPANNKNHVTFNTPILLGITKTDNAAAMKLVVNY